MKRKNAQAELDLSAILGESAAVFADETRAPLPRLTEIAERALGAASSAVFSLTEERALQTQGGRESRLLREAAQGALAEGTAPGARLEHSGPIHVKILYAEKEGAPERALGAWAVAMPGETDLSRWQALGDALTPFFVLGLRQARWQTEVLAAQLQVEQRIREVETVYEIGQAIDKVEIDRLLEMITEKAASVMDAQACSLMLKLPNTDALVIATSYGLADEIVENTRILIGEGIAGRVAATGKPWRINSLADDPRFRDTRVQGSPEIASSICMPMKDEDSAVMGVLCIRRRTPAACFSDEEERLFSIFATQAALAINNAHLYAKLSHKFQELSTLSALTETITSTLNLDQVLNQVADNIIDVVHFDRCRIYLSDTETGRFSARIVRGFYRRADEPPEEYALGEGVIGMIAQRLMPMLVDEETARNLPALGEYGQALGMETFYAQPIVARGRCIGVIVVSNMGQGRPISQDSTDLLSTFVHQAGIAIENARFSANQERRYSELTTLYEFSRTLAATSGVQKAAQTVNELAIRITESDAGLLLLFDADQEGLGALDWQGLSDLLSKRIRNFQTIVPVRPGARALREPRLLNADDAEAIFGPEWQPITEAFLARHRATALVPLVVDDAAVGFLMLGKQGADYGAEALKLIAVASSQAASVLSSAQSYERRIGQRDLELSAIRELMQKVRAATTLEEALSSILDIVASIVWSDEAWLFTVDDNGRTMTVRAARGEHSADSVPDQVLPLEGSSIAAQALRERRGITSEQDGAGANGHYSRMAIPLVVGEEPIGVLVMASKIRGVYTEESIRLLHLVASQAATIFREVSSLRELSRQTENILRSITAGVITIDKRGYIVTWNARAEEIINLRAHQIIRRHYSEFIQRLQVDITVREETMRMVELTAQTGKVFTRRQLCYHTPQGEDIFVNLSASQLKSESGEYLGVVVVFEDITNEIQMKEEMERVRTMAETGQLAANIAHELRNPLQSIRGAAQLLRKELPADYVTEHGEFLDIIIEEVNGLNRITTEFLEFSRVTPPTMQNTSMNAMLSRLLQFMDAYVSDHNIAVCQVLDDRLPDVYMDKSQIEQVVKNVVINAVQAMPHGGTLSVSTRHYPAQGIAEIAFTDTGIGIPANKLEKIFTPFFTTKTKGTGLGLAIARKIVQTHGGRLSAQSTPGEGSTFTLHIPVSSLYANVAPHGRTEITDQRSHQPGEIYSSPDSSEEISMA